METIEKNLTVKNEVKKVTSKSKRTNKNLTVKNDLQKINFLNRSLDTNKISISNKNSKKLYKLNIDILSESVILLIANEFKINSNSKNLKSEFQKLDYLAVNKIFNSQLKAYRTKVRKLKEYFVKSIVSVNDKELLIEFLTFYINSFCINDFSINSFSQSKDNLKDYEKLLKIAKEFVAKNKINL